MGVRSIIDIDVNDSKFKDFLESYAKYDKALKEMPATFKRGGKEAQNLLTPLEDMQAALEKMKGLLEKQNQGFKNAGNSLKGMLKDAKSIAVSIGETTVSLFKWIGVGGILSGLVGAGSLFGLDTLAHGFTNQRLAAGQLGVTPGQQAAARAAYGRYGDTDSMLSNITNTYADLSTRSVFQRNGINPEGKNSYQIYGELLLAAKQKWDAAGPNGHTEQYMHATGLDKLMSLQTWQGIGSINSIQDIKNSNRDAETYRKEYDAALGPDAMKSIANFSSQLSLTGVRLKGLGGHFLAILSNPLSHLSEAFGRLISKLEGNKGLDHIFQRVGKAVDWLAAKLDDPKTQKAIDDFLTKLFSPATLKKVENFTTDIGILADEIHKALVLLGLLPNKSPKASDSGEAPGSTRDKSWHTLNDTANNLWNAASGAFKAMADGAHNTWLKGMELTHGLPSGTLRAISGVESRYGKGRGQTHYEQGHGWVRGEFQLLDSTAASVGVRDSNDFMQASEGAARLMAKYMAKYHDVGKAFAAYNEGEGALDSQLRRAAARHRKWTDELPGGPDSPTNNPKNNVYKYVNDATGFMVANSSTGTEVVVRDRHSKSPNDQAAQARASYKF